MITSTPTTWGHKVMPPSYEDCKPKSIRRKHGYTVEASNFALFFGARHAKRAGWSKRLSPPTIPLPDENIRTIRLLNSWLTGPEVERDPTLERLKKVINANCLSVIGSSPPD